MGVATGFFALLIAAGAGPAVASSANPSISLYATSPVTLAGVRFHASERVRVSVSTRSTRVVLRVTASESGRFRLRLPGVSLGPCDGFLVVAVGSSGSRAVLKVVERLCPPPLMER